jgi:hypothetical protein
MTSDMGPISLSVAIGLISTSAPPAADRWIKHFREADAVVEHDPDSLVAIGDQRQVTFRFRFAGRPTGELAEILTQVTFDCSQRTMRTARFQKQFVGGGTYDSGPMPSSYAGSPVTSDSKMAPLFEQLCKGAFDGRSIK